MAHQYWKNVYDDAVSHNEMEMGSLVDGIVEYIQDNYLDMRKRVLPILELPAFFSQGSDVSITDVNAHILELPAFFSQGSDVSITDVNAHILELPAFFSQGSDVSITDVNAHILSFAIICEHFLLDLE